MDPRSNDERKHEMDQVVAKLVYIKLMKRVMK